MIINILTYNSFKQKILTFALSLMLFSACAPEIETPIEEVTFERLLKNENLKSNILKRDINYAVLLPENYHKTTDSFPVVYLLHGYGDNHSAWYSYGLIQYYSDLYVTQKWPMIFIMPDAFNTYYVNKYNGIYPYMDFFANELVPAIDSIYRTIADKSQRAVMGYSMGGYGALILPAMHPELFSISVPLSMSFRTDEQYLAESQTAYDNQWASVFGGYGKTGTNRLTEYFIEHSPFHFFNEKSASTFSQTRFFIDCGDDEESLSITNGEWHNLLKKFEIAHEYRVRNGGHSWEYWKKSLPEALNFISYGFQNLNYPMDAEPVVIQNPILQNQYELEVIAGQNFQLGIFKPTSYQTDTNSYPAMFIMHDSDGSSRSQSAIEIFSLLNDHMVSGKLPPSLIFEIPVSETEITTDKFLDLLQQIKNNYRIKDNKQGLVLLANKTGGVLASNLIEALPETFNGCFLFDATATESMPVIENQFYYIAVSDKSVDPNTGFDLYVALREKGVNHEYRVHRGIPGMQSILVGMNESISYLSKKLKNS